MSASERAKREDGRGGGRKRKAGAGWLQEDNRENRGPELTISTVHSTDETNSMSALAGRAAWHNPNSPSTTPQHVSCYKYEQAEGREAETMKADRQTPLASMYLMYSSVHPPLSSGPHGGPPLESSDSTDPITSTCCISDHVPSPRRRLAMLRMTKRGGWNHLQERYDLICV